MSNAPTLQSLLTEAMTQAPGLSRHVLNAIQDELDSRPKHFHLLDGWRRMRARFANDFETALLPLLQASARGEDPLQRKLDDINSLSLVDDRQALQDVAVAHVIHAVEEHARAELHQLGNVFAALRGTARALKNENPVRPALFAQALLVALSSVEMEPQARYELMQAASQPMASGLLRLYSALCAQLRAADLNQMVASHAARVDPDAELRLALARRSTQPATLDGLARRVHEHNTRPAPLGQAAAGATAPAAPVFRAGHGPDLLSRLYDQILADPRLLPPLKALLARLQVAVVRLARSDANLLHKQDHPTWGLLNRVAAHGMAFERADDERLQSFLRFIEAEVQGLIDVAVPSAALFQQALTRVEAHLSSQAQQRSERSAQALGALERESMREPWRKLLHEQLAAQTIEAPLGPKLRRFMNTAWVEVIVQAMVLHGRESPQAMMRIEWVDQLMESLHDTPDERSRQRLRQRLPGLIEGLRSGCDAIALPEAQRESVLQELMLQHGRLLRGMSALPDAAKPVEASPRGPNSQELSPEELLQRLLIERESQMSTQWAHTRVNRGHLPTVPVQLYDQGDTPEARSAVGAWLDGLHIGGWYHLFIQSNWLTAQVAWISESGQFFLFVGQDPDQRHSLTRAALERLLTHGLITALDENSLVQRAVDTLMQDLDDAV